jgi:hypothetical protein
MGILLAQLLKFNRDLMSYSIVDALLLYAIYKHIDCNYDFYPDSQLLCDVSAKSILCF